MTLAVRPIVIGDFSGRVGKTFGVPVRGHRPLLTLDACQELPHAIRDGGAFRLEFTGPFDPVLAQGIFPFEIGDHRFEIFIVPLGRSERGMRYEAIFL